MKLIILSTIILCLLQLASPTAIAASNNLLPTPENFGIDTVSSLATWTAPGGTNKLLYPQLQGYLLYLDDSLVCETNHTSCTIPSLVYGQDYQLGIKAKYSCGNSEAVILNFTSGFLPAPGNLIGEAFNGFNSISWNYPEYIPEMFQSRLNSDLIPPGLIGFKIYKEGDSLCQVTDSVLRYNDTVSLPGWYEYTVAAIYDLGYYGHEGMIMESLPAGPVKILVFLYCCLPFWEQWDYGNFDVNSWEHHECENWKIITSDGNPPPTATFTQHTVLNDYSCSIAGYPQAGFLIEDGNIYLDFDLKLNDITSSGTEYFTISIIQRRDTTVVVDEIINSESFNWTNFSYNITEGAKGSDFRLVFTAGGENIQNIGSWMIDNIHIYHLCPCPNNIQAGFFNLPSGYFTLLQWQPPYPSKNPDSRSLTGYEIYRCIESPGNVWKKINEEVVADTFYIDYMIETEGIYMYRIKSIYDQCESEFSDTAIVNVLFTKQKNVISKSLTVFPSPAKDYLYLTSASPIKEIRLISLDGKTNKKTDQLQGTNARMDLSGIKQGIYFLRVITINGEQIVKVVVTD